MQNKLANVFKKAKYDGSSILAENIWQTITIRENHKNNIKLWSSAFLGIISIAGLIPAFKILLGDLAQSGFYEYFSLVFSDGTTVLSYWKEFIFSITESLPTMSIILSLSLIFTLFLSIKYVARQLTKGQLVSLRTLSF
ncbi:MAG: hypothetical protein WC847_01690 [Candidatus Paceibacterota bacterium]|jgi:hypothetical protein